MTNRLYLGLGGNLGDVISTFRQACQRMESLLGHIRAASPIYQTAAWGYTDQPDFLNQVIRIDCELPARQVLDHLLQLELELGRERTRKWGPRTIDLDILAYGDQIINQPRLHLPHPHLEERRFVLRPLQYIAPDWIHPRHRTPISELIAQCPDTTKLLWNSPPTATVPHLSPDSHPMSSSLPYLVFLDSYTLNPGDLPLDVLHEVSQPLLFDHSSTEEGIARARHAEVLLINKFKVTESVIQQLPELRLIVVAATGYDNIDLAAAKKRGITVCNAVGYSTDSVAQHTFALLLALIHRVEAHDQDVAQGSWGAQAHFSYTLSPWSELHGKTFGIYGFGTIGQRVAVLARAFGMQVIVHTRTPGDDTLAYVSLKDLLAQSDVLSLHAPLTEQTKGLICTDRLSRMKPTAFLINTARGGLVVEEDLRNALLQGTIAGAGLDVLSQEPPPDNHPLIGLDRCLITPHIAWASRESRQRLLDITIENIRTFLAGNPQNVVSH